MLEHGNLALRTLLSVLLAALMPALVMAQPAGANRCEVTREWLSDDTGVPPRVAMSALRGQPAPGPIPLEAWLLQDERSQRLFGRPFDQIPVSGLAAYRYNPRDCLRTGNSRRPLFRGNLIDHLQKPAVYRATVEGLRAIRAQNARGSMLADEVAALTPGSDGAARYNSLLADWDALKEWLPPALNRQLASAFSAANTRVAKPTLMAQAQAVAGDAEGIDGLVRILDEKRRLAALGYTLDSNASLAQAYNRIIDELVSADRRTMEAWPAGPGALAAGVDWFGRFDGERGLGRLVGSDRRVRGLRDDFLRTRRATLQRHAGALAQQVAGAPDVAAVRSLMTRHLSLRQDREDDAAMPVFAAAGERLRVLRRDAVLGYASQGPTARRGDAEPTEVDLYDAVERLVLAVNSGIQAVAQRCTARQLDNNAMLGLACLGMMLTEGTDGQTVHGPAFSITRFDKQDRCLPARDGNGWLCTYQIGFEASSRSAPALFNVISNQGGRTGARFVWLGGRWTMLP